MHGYNGQACARQDTMGQICCSGNNMRIIKPGARWLTS